MVIYSHSHSDHIGAANVYPAEATIIAHEKVAAILKKWNDSRRPVPQMTFTDSHTLDVGNQRLELVYKGVNHEPGNIFVYAPRQRVLMLVDVIFPGWVPFTRMAMTEGPQGYLKANEDALEFDFDTFVGGHLTRLGTPEDVRVQKEYFDDVKEACLSALRSINWMEIAQETGFENLWLLFDTYLKRIAQTAAADVVPKWVDRLGAADEFTEDQCWTLMESLRIDLGYLPGPKGLVDEEVWWTARR